MNSTHEQLEAHLATLKLAFFREHYQEVMQQAAKKQWTPEDILLRLAEGEAQQRADRACQRRIKAARFPFLKSLDDFDWSWPKKDQSRPNPAPLPSGLGPCPWQSLLPRRRRAG